MCGIGIDLAALRGTVHADIGAVAVISQDRVGHARAPTGCLEPEVRRVNQVSSIILCSALDRGANMTRPVMANYARRACRYGQVVTGRRSGCRRCFL
jgi:hypothetical protein